jgi:predicted kinase
MDLMERGEREAAWQCLQRYGEQRIDDEGQALLPLFMSVRATVRAKVTGFARRTEADEEGRRRLSEQARSYLALAQALLEPPRPSLVAVGGRSGTGKSSVARALAWRLDPAPGATVLRSDVIRKQLFGRAPTERLPPEAYSDEVSAKVFARIAERAAILLAAGRSVIADAVYGEPAKRRELQAVAQAAGLPFQGIWLEADESVLVERVGRRKDDASDADAEVVRKQREIVPPEDWRRVRADRPLEDVAAAALDVLGGG